MTSDEIRISAQLLTGLEMNQVTSFNLIKEALAYIMRTYPNSAPIEIGEAEVTDNGQAFEFSKELVRIDSVRKSDTLEIVEQPLYTCDTDGIITFYTTGEFKIQYRYLADMPQTIYEAVPIPDKYAVPIKYFLGAMLRGRIYGQGDEWTQDYLNQYYSLLETADSVTNRMSKRHKRMPARY